MLFNFIVGFIISWIIGFYLFKKSPKIVLIIFPITTVISHTVNALGVYLEYWHLEPKIHDTLSYLPFDIGFYPILACLLIYFINKGINSFYSLIFISLSTTILEYIAYLFNKVIYANGWTIYFTFFSYLVSYTLVYFYYLLLQKYEVFSK